jgi:EAL domain-containing protein (putative c-di-GMP-specific phosphodiesterase class I)
MVVRLCEELGAEVVAEGIETRDELHAVCDAGAHYGQGYLLGRPSFPMPPITWPPPPESV